MRQGCLERAAVCSKSVGLMFLWVMVFGNVKHSQRELVIFDLPKDPLILKKQTEIETGVERKA